MAACVANHVAEDRASEAKRWRYLAAAILIALAWGALVAQVNSAKHSVMYD